MTVGAYTDGSWHCSLVEDEYDRGVLRDSAMIAALWGTEATIRRHVEEAIDSLMVRERARLDGLAEVTDSSQNVTSV